MFIGIYNKSTIITYLGITSSMIGIYLALNNNVRYALLCLIIAGVCDIFDGKVARMCKRTEMEELFGVQIDSLADMISFCAFPIIIFYGLGLNSWYHIGLYTLFTLAAITRLGFFNVNALEVNKDKSANYYSGLPVTFVALIFPIAWLLSFCLKANIFSLIYTIIILIVTILFVANIKIKKPAGNDYAIIGIIAIVMSLIIIFVGV